MSKPTRPILRYHGGKWELGPWIIGHFPAHRTYVEAFGGGGSVLIRKPRAYAEIYNDLDGEVVNVFKVVRDQGEKLRRALELTPFARKEFATSYRPTKDPVEQARRTIARTFMGFGTAAMRQKADGTAQNTGFRANSNRSGTTPARDWRNFPGALGATIERLRGVIIECRPAAQVMISHDSLETLHYVDPPYVHSTRSQKNRCHVRVYRHEMTDLQHRELAVTLNSLKGAVVLSGYHSPLYDELYADWERVERPAQADGARPRMEVLWLRNVDRGFLPGL